MTITDVIFLTLLACTFVLGIGMVLIRKDIEELKEIIEENKMK